MPKKKDWETRWTFRPNAKVLRIYRTNGKGRTKTQFIHEGIIAHFGKHKEP